jgi:uncharacterized protein (TIGR00661 family)
VKILFGVQGTGNGHLSRARALAAALRDHPEAEVTWLFSGRPADRFNDMELFGEYWWREGLSFVVRAGRIRHLATARQLQLRRFVHDIRTLDLDPFDCIVTDFEPVVAWAAKWHRRPCIGIGHQYAFDARIPRRGRFLPGGLIMRLFAPVDLGMGLHWHHFNEPILPPIADIDAPPHAAAADDAGRVLVYLPFEDLDEVLPMLGGFAGERFSLFSPALSEFRCHGNVDCYPVSRERFVRALHGARAVICNAGFELVSEALSLGKDVLVKPLAAQLEQESNAEALHALGYARTTQELTRDAIAAFLHEPYRRQPIVFPDVAAELADWLVHRRETREQLAERLWRETRLGAVAPGEQPLRRNLWLEAAA